MLINSHFDTIEHPNCTFMKQLFQFAKCCYGWYIMREMNNY